MNIDPISILRKTQDDPKLGPVAKDALQFLQGAQCKFLRSSGSSHSSLAIARMYEIRRSLAKFKQSAFVGLSEAIESLSERDVNVHLAVIETEKGLISLWLASESGTPIAIVTAKFES